METFSQSWKRQNISNLNNFFLLLPLLPVFLFLLSFHFHLCFSKMLKPKVFLIEKNQIHHLLIIYLQTCHQLYVDLFHSQPSVLFLLFTSLLFLLPPLPLLLHLLLDVFQSLRLFLLPFLLLHGGEQLLGAFHQRLVLSVDLLPGHHRGLEVKQAQIKGHGYKTSSRK